MSNIVNLDLEEDTKAWLANDKNVYVGRSNRFVQVGEEKWGNPFKLNKFRSRQQVTELYRKHVLNNKQLTESVSELSGKVLGCHCSPKLCHAEVLHELAGNIPIYTEYTMDPSSAIKDAKKNEKPPPLTPKPVVQKEEADKPKRTIANLEERLKQLEFQVKQLQTDALNKDNALRKMNERILQLEADDMKNSSYLAVQKNVSDLLSKRVVQLEQYTRRYNVVISGVDRLQNETHESLEGEVTKLLTDAGSASSMEDVDKFHRNGPRRGNDQEIIVRFKSHSAKEEFYRKRKNIPNQKVKIKPSLSFHTNSLLKEAREFLEGYTATLNEYENPPKFVCANIHGNLQVKLAKNTHEGRSFYQFDSIEKLYAIITKFNYANIDRIHDDHSGYYDTDGVPSRLSPSGRRSPQAQESLLGSTSLTDGVAESV